MKLGNGKELKCHEMPLNEMILKPYLNFSLEIPSSRPPEYEVGVSKSEPFKVDFPER